MKTLSAVSLGLAIVLAQSPPVGAIEQVVAGENGIAAPKKTKTVLPAYPPEAQARGQRGIVIVELVIDTEGKVSSAQIIRSIPPFDEAALVAVRQWEYEVTRVNGKPVSVKLTVPITFAMKIPEIASRQEGIPELRAGAFPPLPADAHDTATATAEITLGAEGNVEELRIVDGPPAYADALARALRTWRFSPDSSEATVTFQVHAQFNPGAKAPGSKVEFRLDGLRRSESMGTADSGAGASGTGASGASAPAAPSGRVADAATAPASVAAPSPAVPAAAAPPPAPVAAPGSPAPTAAPATATPPAVATSATPTAPAPPAAIPTAPTATPTAAVPAAAAPPAAAPAATTPAVPTATRPSATPSAPPAAAAPPPLPVAPSGSSPSAKPTSTGPKAPPTAAPSAVAPPAPPASVSYPAPATGQAAAASPPSAVAATAATAAAPPPQAPATSPKAPVIEVVTVGAPAPPPENGLSAIRDVTLTPGVPDLTRGRRPVPPPFARMAQATGTVDVAFSVDAAGIASVKGSTGPDVFKRAAEQTVSSWTFRRTRADRIFLQAEFKYTVDAASATVQPDIK